MKIQIWSDILCPFCYIGKRNLEKALSQFEHRAEVEIEWKSFELDPGSAKNTLPRLAQALAHKYGKSLAEAEQMNARMTATAAAAGLEFHLEKAIPTNSFDAHRLIHLAKKHGKQDQAKEQLFSAYLSEGKDIADRKTLENLGLQMGLPQEEIQQLFTSDQLKQEVREDEEQAYELGVQGVPFFLIDQKLAVSGAQPVDYFLKALDQAWGNSQTMNAQGPSN